MAAEGVDFSFNVFCLWTFILLARPQDYIPILVPLRLALVFTVITTLVTFLRPGGIDMGKIWSRETKLYLLFYAAMIAGIPFAVHRGRTFDLVILGYLVNVVFFVMLLLHVNTKERFRRFALVVMMCAFVFSYFETTLGNFLKGRYYREDSMMYDPNDVAFVAVSFIPFLMIVVLEKFSSLAKAAAALGLLSCVLLALYTGSRGGFLGLLVLFVLFLGMKIPQVGRGRKMVLFGVILVAALVNIEKIDTERLLTMTSPSEDYNMSDEWGRKEIWKRGVILFLYHPITGVGAENFSEAIGTMRAQEGLIPKWQPSHNSFVQVLTETGIFGTYAYFALIVACLKGLARLRRQKGGAADQDMRLVPGILQAGFIAQLIAAFFLTQGYSIFLTFSFAVAAALSMMAHKSDEVRGKAA